MIKVAIDTNPLKFGHKGRGIGYYTTKLIEGLKQRVGLEVIEFSNIHQLEKVDVAHYPTFDFFKPTLPFLKKFPTVVTIHDITPLLFPKEYPPGIKGKLNLFYQSLSLKGVSAIITDSESSRKDIIRYFGVKKDIVFKIHLASDDSLKMVKDLEKLGKMREKYRLPERYAIFVGHANWNKNILNLVKGCLDSGLDLCLVGSDFTQNKNLDHPELRSLKLFFQDFNNNPKIHLLGGVPQEDLVYILNQAELLLLPSYYEGFGLPILEAQSCGVPVVTANTSSMPEIGGEGALFVDPYNSKSITQCILKITTDKRVRNDLIDKGFKNIKRFSLEKMIEETVEVYSWVKLKNV